MTSTESVNYMSKIYDVAIIGAGPAGMSAAIYARRAARSVILFEALSVGGQIVTANEVENYPAIKKISGFDLANELYEQADALGCEFEFARVTEAGESEGGLKRIVCEDGGEYLAKTVIIAVGARCRKLGLENEERLTGSGVSYCAVCDGSFFKGKTVAVNGGGNSAVDDAIYLADHAATVYLIHRRDAFRAEDVKMEQLASKSNIILRTNAVVEAINGSSLVESLTLRDTKTGETSELAVDGLFVAIGRVPETEVFSELVELDSSGYIVAGEDCRTKHPGVFVAGDCRTKSVRQLVTAASDGAIAAIAASEYINSLK